MWNADKLNTVTFQLIRINDSNLLIGQLPTHC